jgi:hypothetical protein
MEPAVMDNGFIQWLVNQGAGASLGVFMFLMYRKDSLAYAQRQTDSAAAYMAYGKEVGLALANVAASLVRHADVLDRIERHLSIAPK